MITLAFGAIVFLAFVVEAASGFGATLVTVSLASQLLPVPTVLATFIPVNVFLSLYLAVRHHDAIAWRALLTRVLPFMGAGLAAGIALFQLREQGFLRIAFAIFVIVLAAVSLARRHRPPLVGGPAAGPGLLLGAGVIHGLFACGGPLAVAAISRDVRDKTAFRSTLAVLWLVMNGVLVPSYVLAGSLDATTLRGSLTLIPALVLGTLAGEWVHARIAPERFRIVVNGLLLAAGIALLVRSLA